MKKSTGNIEYYRNWQIDKNKSPGSLHDKFSDDKIYHGIDWTLNLGMAEAKEMEKEFQQIYESKMNEWIESDDIETKMFNPTQLLIKSFVRDREWWEEKPQVYNAAYRLCWGRGAPDIEDL